MKKKVVGIFAKYNASEQCFAAMYLAAYVERHYRQIKWFSPTLPVVRGGQLYGFSDKYDKATLHTVGKNRSRLPEWLEDCAAFIFFEPSDEIYDLLPDNTTTTLVVNPYTWNKDVQKFASKCDYALAPCRLWYERFAVINMPTTMLLWPFDPTVQNIFRRGIDWKSPKLFFPAYDASPPQRKFIQKVASIVKQVKPDASVAVAFYDARVTPLEGLDSRAYDWKFVRYLQNADWVVDLNPRPFLSFYNTFAASYGLQYSGYDILPNTDPLNAARRHLIPTKTRQCSGNCVEAVPDMETVAYAIAEQLEMPFDPDENVGALDIRRVEFLRATNEALGFKKC
jgi:hypothetical protein